MPGKILNPASFLRIQGARGQASGGLRPEEENRLGGRSPLSLDQGNQEQLKLTFGELTRPQASVKFGQFLPPQLE